MSLSHFLMNCFVDGCLPRFREELLPIEIWMGVELHLNEPVEQLEFVDRQIVGVTTNRRHYPTNSLVINSDFARTMQRLVPDHLRRKWSDRKLAATKFSYATFMMYLGVEGLYDLPHHTIHIASDYHRNLDEIENQHVLSADPSFYVQNVCVTDSTLAPQGHSTLYILVPVTHQHPNVDWSKETPAFRENVLSPVSPQATRRHRSRCTH